MKNKNKIIEQSNIFYTSLTKRKNNNFASEIIIAVLHRSENFVPSQCKRQRPRLRQLPTIVDQLLPRSNFNLSMKMRTLRHIYSNLRGYPRSTPGMSRTGPPTSPHI